MAISENSLKVWDIVKEATDGITLADLGAALGLTPRQANGCVVAFQRRKVNDEPVMARKEVKIMVDGVEKTEKLIYITEAGQSFDPRNIPEKPAK